MATKQDGFDYFQALLLKGDTLVVSLVSEPVNDRLKYQSRQPQPLSQSPAKCSLVVDARLRSWGGYA